MGSIVFSRPDREHDSIARKHQLFLSLGGKKPFV